MGNNKMRVSLVVVVFILSFLLIFLQINKDKWIYYNDPNKTETLSEEVLSGHHTFLFDPIQVLNEFIYREGNVSPSDYKVIIKRESEYHIHYKLNRSGGVKGDISDVVLRKVTISDKDDVKIWIVEKYIKKGK